MVDCCALSAVGSLLNPSTAMRSSLVSRSCSGLCHDRRSYSCFFTTITRFTFNISRNKCTPLMAAATEGVNTFVLGSAEAIVVCRDLAPGGAGILLIATSCSCGKVIYGGADRAKRLC